ncbi:MAG: hypothetical protein K9J85_05080 [Desulfobacteraceae bacterium]|nr:hypothetical protein [Desulfobacteraceae bacterium]
MAANFRIKRHSRSKNIYFDLVGDFDGTSAMELLHDLEKHAQKGTKVYVNTACLSSVAAFGEDLFKKQCRLFSKYCNNLVFTGRYGDRIQPAP